MCIDNHESLKGCMIIRRKDNEKINTLANCRTKKWIIWYIFGRNLCITEQFSRV